MNELNNEDIIKSMRDKTISHITNTIIDGLEKAQNRALIYSIIDIYFKEYSYEKYCRKYCGYNKNIDLVNNPSFIYDANITKFNYIAKYPILSKDDFDFIGVIRRQNEFEKRGDNNE